MTRPGSNSRTSTWVRCLDTQPRTPKRAAAGVEEGHCLHVDIAIGDAEPVDNMMSIVDEPAVVEERTLRKSGGARCVLQHDGVGRSDLWEIAGELVGSGEEMVPVVEADDVLEFGAFGLDALGRGEHRIAAMRWHDEHCPGLRLCEHVVQLVSLERWVDGDDHHAGHGAAELEELPLGNVVRPDGDVAPRLEPVE